MFGGNISVMATGDKDNVLRWIESAQSAQLVDGTEGSGEMIRVRSGDVSLILSWYGDSYAVIDESRPSEFVEVRGKAPASAVRFLANSLFGTGSADFDGKAYSDVSVYPYKATGTGLEFRTPSGRSWVCSSSEPRITMGLYDLLYAAGNEAAILMMPMLWAEGTPTVALQSAVDRFKPYFFTIRSEFLSSRFTATLGDVTVPPASARDVAAINSVFGDNSKIGNKAPVMSTVIGNSDEMTLQLKDRSLCLLCSSMVNGIGYTADAHGTVDSSKLSAVLELEGSSYSDLPYGIAVREAQSKSLLGSAYRGKTSVEARSGCWVKSRSLTNSERVKVASRYFPAQVADALTAGMSVDFSLG